MPEPKGCLPNEASVPGTSPAAGWSKVIRRCSFCAAAAVVGEWRTVAANLVEFECGRCCCGNCGGRHRRRDSRRLRDGNTVIALICRTPRVFSAVIGVDIKFRRWVELKFTKSVSCTNQGYCAVGTEC